MPQEENHSSSAAGISLMKLRLATWNVNSVRRRLAGLKRLTTEFDPDVICLQETKVEDAKFPASEISELGYKNQIIYGQKSYHGVAICSRYDLIDDKRRDWSGKTEGRHVYCRLDPNIELHNFYVPAGGNIPDQDVNEKFLHKLKFLEEMSVWFANRRSARAILVGDLNVAPSANDVWSHTQLLNVVSHTPIEVTALKKIMEKGNWVDAVRHFTPETRKLFSWWSYRARDWSSSNRGRRLDHIWVTPGLLSALDAAWILRDIRGWPDPSDHVPVLLDLDV